MNYASLKIEVNVSKVEHSVMGCLYWGRRLSIRRLHIKCTSCPSCNQHCKDFVRERCNRLDRAPYVCNGCDKGHVRCTIPHKYHYDALFADRRYRETLPKGTSFEHLTQWVLNLIVNNINSVPRQSLLGLTPYQTAKENFDMDVLLALQLKPIEPDKINLTPELIK